MMTAAALLIALIWKSQKIRIVCKWLVKKSLFCLLKLPAVCQFRTGDYDVFRKFKQQWEQFLLCGYVNNSALNVREHILPIL